MDKRFCGPQWGKSEVWDYRKLCAADETAIDCPEILANRAVTSLGTALSSPQVILSLFLLSAKLAPECSPTRPRVGTAS